jgi:sigma-B regulation protein RsbU (phosphoserine phosphatase)
MKVLIAEDEFVSSALLQNHLRAWGYTPIAVGNGSEALDILMGSDAPELALIDWLMPSLTGLEVCQQVRQFDKPVPPYIILVTGRNRKEDIIQGLRAGAQDYVTKPFDEEELRARVDVGRRMIELQQQLAKRVAELEEAGKRITQLHGLLPMCRRCRKVRDDGGYWSEVETYITRNFDAKFSEGLCPECYTTALSEIHLSLKGSAENKQQAA